jgi:hypothetical protein
MDDEEIILLVGLTDIEDGDGVEILVELVGDKTGVVVLVNTMLLLPLDVIFVLLALGVGEYLLEDIEILLEELELRIDDDELLLDPPWLRLLYMLNLELPPQYSKELALQRNEHC